MDTNSEERIEQTVLKYDDVIKTIGEFGPYQKRLYTFVILPAIFSAYIVMSSVFYLSDHSHRCAAPEEQNKTFFHNDSSSQSENITVIYSECYVSVILAENTSNSETSNHEEQTQNNTCGSWIYDNAIFEETVISDFNLVCERGYLRSHTKMVIFAGNMAGSLFIGTLADIFGRKPTLCLSLILMVVSSYAIVWTTSYGLLLFLRFIYGVGDSGYYLTAFVIGLELVGPSKRIWTGYIINFIWCAGEFLLVGMSFLLKNWRLIQLAASIPMTFFIFYWKLIPESPRWLISRGRLKEASRILNTAAKVNKVSFKNSEFEKQLTFLMNPDSQKNPIENAEQIKFNIIAVVTSKRMLLTTVIMGLNCFVAYSGYYGISLTIGNLAGNIYLDILISVFVEFGAYLLCILLFDRVGHRRFQSGCLLIGGTAILCTLITSFIINNSPLLITIVSAMIGKLCVSAIYAEIFVYLSELYPTSVRTFVLGIMSLIGQIGSVSSPYIADITYYVDSDFGKALPVMIFGTSMVAVGALTLLLPETNHTDLPETMKEAKSLGRYTAPPPPET